MVYRSNLVAKFVSAALLLSIVIVPASAVVPDKDDLTVEQIIAKHLESIGTPEARAGLKSRVIIGKATSVMRIGGSGQVEGNAVLASQGTSSLFGLSFSTADYPHDKIGFDGKTLKVADVTPGNKSLLGEFFMKHEMPFKEGLIGGTLSIAWPLLDITARKATVKLDGTKKIDGRKTYVLKYETKNDSGLKTRIFLDAETFQHVRTEYEQRQIQQMATEPGRTQKQGDSITKLIEEFSDFKVENGVMLPHSYKIQLSIETLTQRFLQDWQLSLGQFVANRNLEPKEFDVIAK
jgi:hypothetical protein